MDIVKILEGVRRRRISRGKTDLTQGEDLEWLLSTDKVSLALALLAEARKECNTMVIYVGVRYLTVQPDETVTVESVKKVRFNHTVNGKTIKE